MVFRVQRTPTGTAPALEYWDHYEGLRSALSMRFEELSDLATSCPDYPALAKYDSHYVFIYNRMKSGFKKEKEILGSKLIGFGVTKPHFNMFTEVINNQYREPLILLADNLRESRAPIYGEVYQMSPEKIAEMDWHEDAGPVCQRLRLPIDTVIDQKGQTKQIFAWTYVHHSRYWSSRMDRLSTVTPLISRNTGMKYFNFLKIHEQISQ